MFHPTNASWANLIEAHFGSLRQFTLANSQHPNHTAKTRALHAYLRWRNANARHPDILAAQRRNEPACAAKKGIRWGGRLRNWVTALRGHCPPTNNCGHITGNGQRSNRRAARPPEIVLPGVALC